MDALAGAADHCVKSISLGEPGMAGGAMLFDTKSKMPALVRSLKSVASKTAFKVGV